VIVVVTKMLNDDDLLVVTAAHVAVMIADRFELRLALWPIALASAQ
jgi:hypothetical protein